MLSPGTLREIYGSVFLCELQDGQLIPFKPLSIQAFLEYERLVASKFIPVAVIEDEIFKRCVTDPVLIKNFSKLKAGTVSMVAKAIMDHSGPTGINEFNESLEAARHAINIHPLYSLIDLICTAFPGHTPDSVLEMDYESLLKNLAFAEHKLLKMGMIKEPVSLISTKEPSPSQQKKKYDPGKLKKAFEEKQTRENVSTPSPLPSAPSSSKDTVISTTDMMEHQTVYVGHEKEDLVLEVNKMVNEAAKIYQDNKIVTKSEDGKLKVKPYEERMKEARDRIEKNKKLYQNRKKPVK